MIFKMSGTQACHPSTPEAEAEPVTHCESEACLGYIVRPCILTDPQISLFFLIRQIGTEFT